MANTARKGEYAVKSIEGKENISGKIRAYGQGLLASMLVTGILLVLLSLGLYQFRWGDRLLQIGIWLVYGLSALAGGFWVGKKLRNRRFLWGMLLGLLYFGLLLLVSSAVGEGFQGGGREILTACAICLAGGMAGGMIS